jgi:TetR/AcrR family transcriptional regulator, transcriptional repressor for nem operon
LLDVSLGLIRQKGYTATSVDCLCEAAGVTEGAFFHHFKSKDALEVASATYWGECTSAFFAAASYHSHSDPV